MKKILVVIDMQNDFIVGELSTAESLKATKNGADKIRSFDGDIFLTLDTHYDNYACTAQGRHIPIPHCINKTKGHELYPEIADALQGKNYHTVQKSAFGSFELIDLIAEKVDTPHFHIEVIGLCTDICVISNALMLKSFFNEAEISVDASCCAGSSSDLHRAAIKVMESCCIDITNDY